METTNNENQNKAIELTPAELEMIQLKREQAEAAKKEKEIEAKISLEKSIDGLIGRATSSSKIITQMDKNL